MNHSQLEGNRGEGRSLSLKRPSNNCGLYISIYTILTLSKIHYPFWEQQQKVKGEGMEELGGTSWVARGNARARHDGSEGGSPFVWKETLMQLWFNSENAPVEKERVGGRKRGCPGEVRTNCTGQLWTRSCWTGHLCPAVGAVSVSQHLKVRFFSCSASCAIRFSACNILLFLLPHDPLQTCRVHLHKNFSVLDCVTSSTEEGLSHSKLAAGIMKAKPRHLPALPRHCFAFPAYPPWHVWLSPASIWRP